MYKLWGVEVELKTENDGVWRAVVKSNPFDELPEPPKNGEKGDSKSRLFVLIFKNRSKGPVLIGLEEIVQG